MIFSRNGAFKYQGNLFSPLSLVDYIYKYSSVLTKYTYNDSLRLMKYFNAMEYQLAICYIHILYIGSVR